MQTEDVVFATDEDRHQMPVFANPQAERAVLGAALIDPDAAMRLPSMLSPGDYFVQKHGWVHEAIATLVKAGIDIDMLTLSDELGRTGYLEESGGLAFLAELDTPSALYIEHHSAIVKRNAWLRRAIGAFGQIVQHAYEEQDPDVVYAFAQQQLRTLQPPRRHDITMTWEESFHRTFEMLESFEKTRDHERFRWPWASWNNLIDPVEPGLVVEIAGDTGIGKTIYAECLADFWAKVGVKVGFLHYELNPVVMLQRRLVRWTGLPLRTVKSRDKDGQAWETIYRAQERLNAWPGRIDYAHTAGMDIDATVQEMERMRDIYGTEAFILDHMKKLHRQASPRQMRLRLNETQRQADNVDQFKTACETLGVRGVILNHYNKSGKAVTGTATKNDIAGAGEQSDFVNVIVLLNRSMAQGVETDPYTGTVLVKPGERSNIVNVKVDKNTMGAEGHFLQWMDPEHFMVIDRQFDHVPLNEDD